MNTLREAIHEYIEMRRNLGFKMNDTRRDLLTFATFMEQQQVPFFTVELALAWAQQPVNALPAHWACRLSRVRVFARHRKATDPRTEIPAPGLLPFQPRRATPYLYSDKEIRKLLQAALDMPYANERCALHPWTYHCLFGLLAVSGIRVGEACNLELRDIDFHAEVLTIRGAKSGRDRLVPLHGSTCEVLADYVARRRRHWHGRPVSPYLFVSSRGNRLDKADITRTFHRLSRLIGLRGRTDRHGPRLHDMRHRFANALW